MKIDENILSNYKEQIQEAINDLKTKGKRYRQIPNILTLMRLTAPCFILPAAAIGNMPLVLGATAFFGLTDAVDGFIARKFELTSELGATLDAVTDKLFAATLLTAASFANPILLCNLGLEAIIASINVSKKLKGLPVKSSLIGKIKTWFLFGLSGLGIVSPSLDIASILNPLMSVTTAMQVLTISSYLSNPAVKGDVENIAQDESISVVISCTNENETRELQKEKVLETDTTPVIVQEENESVRQLKALRGYLESEKEFLDLDNNSNVGLVNIEKSKMDDFKI